MTEAELRAYGEEVKILLRRHVERVDDVIAEAIRCRNDPENSHPDSVAGMADDIAFDAYEFRITCLYYARGEDLPESWDL